MASSIHAQTTNYVEQFGIHYYAIVNLDGTNVSVLRGKTGKLSKAQDSIILAPETRFRIWLFQPESKEYATATFTTPQAGQRYDLPDLFLRSSTSTDTDGDGLSDLAEYVLGTNPLKADTDGDGILDGAEVDQGTDPLDGLPATVGIIAATDTPGTAVDVCAINDLAVVANRDAGVSVLNVAGQNPIRIAQVDTPGTALRVACSGNLIAVADGASGLVIIDITDPPAARILHQVNLGSPAQAVTAAGGLAYAGLAIGEIVTVDLASGFVLSRRSLGASVQDLAFSGDHLLAVTSSALLALNPYELDLPTLGSVGTSGGVRLVAGNGLAYVTVGSGFDVFAFAESGQPSLVRQNRPGQIAWRHFVLNGSGIGIAAVTVSVPSDPANFEIYNLPAPGQPPQFTTLVNTPGDASAVSIYNGRAYAADGVSGLQVINYLAYDAGSNAPNIALSTSFVLSTPTNGVAEEGKLVRVTASVTDDVQVRNVEFYVDGARVLTDGNFPFEHRFVTPRITMNKTSFTLRAKATDTGGNFQWSDEILVALTPDATPPEVTSTIPPNLAIVGSLNVIAAYFIEPVNPATISGSTFFLHNAGADGIFWNADDVAITNGVINYREGLGAAFINFPTNLPPGAYRATVRPPLADAAGNQLTSPYSWHFWVTGGVDSDQDGIPDAIEIALGLDPHNPDSNGNGILDGDEDPDGDGLRTRWELLYGYDPRKADTDGNGVPDGLEDPDFDTLNNLAEQARGTNPFKSDSDGDGWDDATEIAVGTDPLTQNLGTTFQITSRPAAYFNGVFDAPTTNVVWSAASPPVSYFNGLFDVPPTNANWSVFSPAVSYFNGLFDLPPTNTTWSAFSPAVSYFNGIFDPSPTNVFLVSPIVSYENQ